MHYDNAEVTLNVNIGGSWEGSRFPMTRVLIAVGFIYFFKICQFFEKFWLGHFFEAAKRGRLDEMLKFGAVRPIRSI